MRSLSMLAACAALCAPLILGGGASDDARLNGKVLELAIREAVNAGLLPALAPR